MLAQLSVIGSLNMEIITSIGQAAKDVLLHIVLAARYGLPILQR